MGPDLLGDVCYPSTRDPLSAQIREESRGVRKRSTLPFCAVPHVNYIPSMQGGANFSFRPAPDY